MVMVHGMVKTEVVCKIVTLSPWPHKTGKWIPVPNEHWCTICRNCRCRDRWPQFLTHTDVTIGGIREGGCITCGAWLDCTISYLGQRFALPPSLPQISSSHARKKGELQIPPLSTPVFIQNNGLCAICERKWIRWRSTAILLEFTRIYLFDLWHYSKGELLLW